MRLQVFPKPVRRPGEFALGLFLFLAALHFGANVFSGVRFDQEKIEIWALDGQTQITGLYHYVNRSALPSSLSIAVPFPVDSNHPWPAVSLMEEVDDHGAFRKRIETFRYHEQTMLRLWFGPMQEKWVRLEYIQGSHVPEARYILVSTRKWGRPLDHGQYILHLGEGLELESSNYPLTKSSHGNSRDYFFNRSNFLPQQDWEFRWRADSAQPVVERNGP